MKRKIVIVGGGAAGCFAAIRAAEVGGRAVSVEILEGGREILTKVRVSGGGRCNVTHHCFDPAELIRNYPRGGRELRGPFHHFQPRDMMAWLEQRGVPLKTEEDGRVFPVSDQSESIIDCLRSEMRRLGVQIFIGKRVADIQPAQAPAEGLELSLQDGSSRHADRLMLAVGSLARSPIADALTQLGHTITPLAPSLFAFNCKDPRIAGLAGLSVPHITVRVPGTKLEQSGPVLITHRGLSGPAILKTSAWGARELAERNYQFTIEVDWTGGSKEIIQRLQQARTQSPKRKVANSSPDSIPQRLWSSLLDHPSQPNGKQARPLSDFTWAHLRQDDLQNLIHSLTHSQFQVHGKSTHKEEFVTCGGVHLKEIDFRTMQSRLIPHLHFGGECLDIDGVTGGFNFQAAWTTGFLAGNSLSTPPS